MLAVRKALSASAAFAALALAAAPASAATVLNVDWDESCGKTTCFKDGRYTHTWSAANAAGPINIGQLLLDRSILGDLDSKVFRLSFQLNGEELGSWGSYLMAGIGGDELNFWGQAFTWNPEDGDLVLVLELAPPPKPGAAGFVAFAPLESGFDGERGPGPFGGNGPQPQQQQLQQSSGPNDFAASAAPEPAAWALMIGGFGLAGAALRRRRAPTAA